MGVDIEMGNWAVPLVMSAAAFGFAVLSSGRRAPGEGAAAHRLRCGALYGLTAIATISCWLAWARVVA